MKTWQAVLLLSFGYVALATGQSAPAPSPDKPALSAALAKACEAGNLDQVKELIGQGAPLDTPSGHDGNTPLIFAAGHLDVMRYLIAQGAKLDGQDAEGSTALLHTCWDSQTDCALYLINAGANPNLGSKWNRFPLMYAAKNGLDPVIAALLAHHADINATNNEGPAIWWAASSDKMSTTKLLLDAGADLKIFPDANTDPLKRMPSLVGEGAAYGDPALIDLLLAHGADINGTAPDGIPALTTAVEWHKLEAVKDLLGKGAAVDLADQDGQTALISAATHPTPDFVQALLDAHAKPNLQDKDGKTALIWACDFERGDNVKCLLDQGADVNVADAKGETALTHAGNRGDVDLVDLFKAKGANRTDVHIIATDDPPPSYSPAQLWAVSVSAIYVQKDGESHKCLGNGATALRASDMLREGWGAHDRKSFIKVLTDLVATGHRAGYQAEGAKLAQMSGAEFDLLLVAHPTRATEIKAMRASYLKWKDKSGLAWDLCRAGMLINNGYDAKYLREEEAWNFLGLLARQVQGGFGSWQEMSDNFLDGREIWANGRDPRFTACAQLLLNPHDSNSPWNQVPWQTDLTQLSAPH